MKLHLPKLLFVAIIAAASFSYAVDYTTDSEGNKLYNVGQHTGNNTPSGSKYMWVSEADLTLSNSDKLGIIQGEALYTGAMTGQVLEKWTHSGLSLSAKKDSSSTGMVTKNVKVNGTLTIEDTAQVVLGGQHRTSGAWGLGSTDEYTGIIADKVVVNGGKNDEGKYITNLSTWNASLNTLEVNSGNVSIHTNGNGNKGNSSIVVTDPEDSKQVRIKELLNVNGGTVTIGNNSANTADRNANDDHCQVGFGNGQINNADYAQSTITQSWIKQGAGENAADSTLKIEGKSVSVGGLNIEQHKGTMSVSNENYHIIADNGITYDSQVIQYGDAKLTLGGILAENKYKDQVKDYTGFGDAEFHVTQHGNGVINMTNGIVFNYNSSATKEEHSSFTQNANGTINLSGVFGRNDASSASKWAAVYFDINQNGAEGTINLKNGATMSAGDIVQTADATLNLKGNAQMTAQSINQSAGSIVVEANAQLQAGTLNAGVITQSAAEDGNVHASIQATNVALADGSISSADAKVTITGTLAADNITVNNGGTLENSVNSVISVGNRLVLESGSKLVNNGVITASSAYALMTADEQAAAVLSETDGPIILKEGSAVLNAGIIDADVVVQGGTLTLGEGGITQNITMESGNILVEGSAVQTGAMTLTGGTITFKNGASVALNDNITYDLSGAEIIVLVEDVNNVKGSTLTLFSGNGNGSVTGLESATFTFQDMADSTNTVGGKITDLGSGSIKVEATVAIPEPTTATLSLLALAGLCARRRRK